MENKELTINLALESEKTFIVPYTCTTTVEDICIIVCKHLNIGPIARHLFALRITGKPVFLMPNATIQDRMGSVEFRIRFKVAHVSKLRKLDENAYNYYFHQARVDVLEEKIPDMTYEEHGSQMLGLSITDMFRLMVEKDYPRDMLERKYKKFVPKSVLKKHLFFTKKPIHENLVKLEAKAPKDMKDASYIKSEYLNQLDFIAPEYLAETYRATTDIEGRQSLIIIKVPPPHVKDPHIKYCIESRRELKNWINLFTIEDLGDIAARSDGTTEISRLNGIPVYLKFHSISSMWSFVSLLDGYYRLTCKWTFNLCPDLQSPSLTKLRYMRCHGPVGGVFSYAKLEAKTNNRRGCFIIRESETSYTTYYIDVCLKDGSKPTTFKLECIKDDHYIFQDDDTVYKNLQQLINAYNNPDDTIYFKECLRPTEYDVTPLLLCRSDTLIGDSVTDSSALLQIPPNPVIINYKDLQVYKGQQKEGFRRISHVYKGMWRVEKGKKIQVALKYLKHDHVNNFMSYFTMIGQWASVKSSVIVRFFGLTFFNNEVSMVMEYFKLGPLDQYLRNNKEIIKTVDLLEAASNLGLALWHLRENDIVHGMIRCRKLMVSCHEENSFTIKLSDHGIHTTYEESEIHWIPIECYSNLDKRSTSVDVWAFATTLYEIFTYGTEIPLIDHNQTMRWYMNDNRLPQPPCCPDEIYTLMIECWHADPYWRKQPQEISRDVNQFMYQVYNSRKKHSYDFARPRTISSNNSVHSALTENTDVGELISASDPEIVSTQSISDDSSSQKWLLHSQSLVHINRDESFSNSCGLTQIFSNLACSTATSSLDSLVSMQSIFELNDNFSVVLKGRIGQGFYGDVFKGSLENTNDPTQEPVTVAVKKLKSFAADNCVRDFHREITIMRSLNHPNIVEILGVTSEPDLQLVMEFMPHGSLQSYLKYNKDKLDSNQLLNFARDIARGMDYLGQKGIVHRDLASRNILVVDRSHVKISDFGLAQFVDSNNYYILKSLNRELPIKWYAPESLAEGKFSVKSDVWSYGVTLFETFTYGEDLPSLGRIHPYPEGQEQCFLLQAIQNGDRYPCPKDCEQTIYVNVMRPCWETDPHKRPPFKKLVSDINDLLHNY
ncbi:hypothetical protein ABEB36_015403 [Hypothenemus hampei]|uniref:non-specific protein-tyrosine kinase n=1 Tax=Hypothenemus hampei TaxID=57062 RepID=A0ABD1E0D5_HYPHA